MSIIDKLKLNQFSEKLILSLPENRKNLFSEFKEYKTDLSESTSFDLIFAFVFTLDEMKNLLEKIISGNKLNKKGYLFFAYPKKDNKEFSVAIHRDDIFPFLQVDEEGYALGSKIKFSRMVSLDDTFTVVGLKQEEKLEKKSTAKSQCVDDYINHIDDVKIWLKKNNLQALTFYESLTFGYQKDWARYIYSAEKEETQQNRLKESSEILTSGFKSRDLYKQGKK